MTISKITLTFEELDDQWCATCPEYPSISVLEDDPVKAMTGLVELVRDMEDHE